MTDAERAQLEPWAQKWIQIGLSTERLDLPRFSAAARDCYRYAGLEEPRAIIPVSSPLVLALAGPIAALAIEELRRNPGSAVGSAVRSAVRSAVDSAVGSAVDSIRRGDLRYVLANSWYQILGGQFWVGSGWSWWGSPSYVSFLQDVCGLELPGDIGDRARAYQATAESACWWWPHRDFVMVSDRPLNILRDDEGRLHSEAGPALDWGDGFAIYAWHGVQVPRKVIEAPDQLTAGDVQKEDNAEVRRIMIERMGRERFIAQAGAKIIHADSDGLGRPRRLLRIDRRDDSAMVFVEVTNSTPEPDGHHKVYQLRVPPSVTTCQQAVAWTFGIDVAAEYQPLVET